MCVHTLRAVSDSFSGVDVGQIRPVADLRGEQRPGSFVKAPFCTARSVNEIGSGLRSGHFLRNAGIIFSIK